MLPRWSARTGVEDIEKNEATFWKMNVGDEHGLLPMSETVS